MSRKRIYAEDITQMVETFRDVAEKQREEECRRIEHPTWDEMSEVDKANYIADMNDPEYHLYNITGIMYFFVTMVSVPSILLYLDTNNLGYDYLYSLENISFMLANDSLISFGFTFFIVATIMAIGLNVAYKVSKRL